MPEKRELEEGLNLDQVKVYLLDNEGTTTPLSFAQDKVSAHLKEHLETYLKAHYEEEQCLADIAALREQTEKDKEEEGFVPIEESESDKDDVIKSVVANIQWLLEGERKVPALLQLQAHMVEDAYAAGDIKGEVFGDVHESLKKWTGDEKKVYIYSSGTSDADKLHFEHSTEGDLQPLISGYFDAETGDKVRSESYTKIAEEVAVKPEEILFLTDAAKEANAAKTAGLQVAVMVRPGNKELEKDEQVWDTFASFSEIAPQMAKKEKV